MTIETFEKATVLIEEINNTKEAITNINVFISEIEKNKERKIDTLDDCYSLYIGKYSDKSGVGFDLNRRHGNSVIIYAIKDILEKQLTELNENLEYL